MGEGQRPRLTRGVLPVALTAAIVACHGGSFVVEAPLAGVPKQEVSGPTFAATCETDVQKRVHEPTSLEALALAAPVLTRVGEATLTIGKVDLVGKVEREAQAFRLSDLVGVLARVEEGERTLARIKGALNTDPLEATAIVQTEIATRAGKERAAQIKSAVDDRALDGLLNAAHSIQTATIPYVMQRGGRTTVGTCVASLTASLGVSFERPPYVVACTMVPEDGPVRRLQIVATGSGLNTTYRGAVLGPEMRWDLASQNQSVMGAGMVTGFDVRSHGPQIAAVSFLENGPIGADAKMSYVSRAWLMPQSSPSDDDLLATTIALSSALPRATLCDAGILTARGSAPESPPTPAPDAGALSP